MRQHRRSCLDGPRSPVLRRAPRNQNRRSAEKGNESAATPPEDRDTPQPAAAQIRVALVRRVRAELALGTYLTAEKWEIALDSLARCLTSD